MSKMTEQMEKRSQLLADARKLQEAGLTTETEVRFDKLVDEADAIMADLERAKRLDDADAISQRSAGRVGATEIATETATEIPVAELRSMMSAALLDSGRDVGTNFRALSKGTTTAGGYLSAAEDFRARLIEQVRDITIMRELSNVLPVLQDASTLGVPTVTANAANASWTGEVAAVAEDSTLAFGRRALTPNQLTALIKVSKRLLNNSAMPAEGIVLNQLAGCIAAQEEAGFMTGSGSGQPLGVFTASVNGISTGRDVDAGNTATAVTYAGLVNALMAIKAQYRKNATWVLSRALIANIRKLTDTTGQPIWSDSVQVGNPAMLLGFPVAESEYVPDTFTTGLYVGMIGDFSRYWIVDAMPLELQHLVELYAGTGQDGYISRSWVDGAPVQEDAFARITLA